MVGEMRIGIDASRAFVKEPTGTERYAFEVITGILGLLQAREHEWILYVKKSQNTRLVIPDRANVTIVEIPLKYLWTQVGLALRTWTDRLDVLWIPAHTLPVLRRPGIRTVVTIHGIEYEWLPAYENKLQRWYLPLSTRYAVGSASRIISVSEFTKKQLIERLNGDQNKIKVIPEGYDSRMPDFKYQVTNQKIIFNKFKITPKQYLLFVGTVQPRKNLVKLIKVFARITRGNARLKLVIAGKLGWSYEEVLKAPDKFGVEDRVVITGYIDDYTRQVLLHQALVYVQPSITEGFGLPVLEAMAAGVPVLSSNGGALGEVTGEAGGLFDPGNEKEMLKKLKEAVESPKWRREMINRGQERVKMFGWDKAALETFKLIVSDNAKTL
jgi:glycosyltransferase involved in cell wall biosynthesis